MIDCRLLRVVPTALALLLGALGIVGSTLAAPAPPPSAASNVETAGVAAAYVFTDQQPALQEEQQIALTP